MQESAGDEDALLHAFRVGGDRRVAVLVEPEKPEELAGFALDLALGELSQSADELQVLQAGEVPDH